MGAAVLLLSGCDRPAPPPPAPTQPKAVLMVTWLIPGQPPTSTQTDMTNMAACDTAKQSAVLAGEAAKADRERQNAKEKAEAIATLQAASVTIRAEGGILSGPGPEEERKLRGVALPQVSAFCIER